MYRNSSTYSSSEDEDNDAGAATGIQEQEPTYSSSIPNIENLVNYIPMRLTNDERVLLKVLENALEVCEYTDVVDVTFSHTHKSKQSRILECLVDVLSISLGLLMANNLTKGEDLIVDKTLNNNIPFFRDLFEVGRRFKIMNPQKMRNTYGKLMYILMDCESHQVKSETGATFVKEILTIREFLKERGANMNFIREPNLAVASAIIEQYVEGQDASASHSANACAAAETESEDDAEFEDAHSSSESARSASLSSERRKKNMKAENGESSTGGGRQPSGRTASTRVSRRKTATELKRETDAKAAAVAALVQKYQTDTFTESDIVRVIDSIGDNKAYRMFNVKPVEEVIQLLREHFRRDGYPEAGVQFGLDLKSGGRSKSNAHSTGYMGSGYSLTNLYEGFSMGFNRAPGGAKLSHDHSTQFTYVLQSLSFWRETMENMPLLWYYADKDMCHEGYRLCDTGQGYQRVQQCPSVRSLMHRILGKVQRSFSEQWVGLSVIHLGDRDVPNGKNIYSLCTMYCAIFLTVCDVML
jgi:hypothetical protein